MNLSTASSASSGTSGFWKWSCLLSSWRLKSRQHQVQTFCQKVTTLPTSFGSKLNESQGEETEDYWGNVFHFCCYCKMPTTQTGGNPRKIASKMLISPTAIYEHLPPKKKSSTCPVLRLLKLGGRGKCLPLNLSDFSDKTRSNSVGRKTFRIQNKGNFAADSVVQEWYQERNGALRGAGLCSWQG